MKLHSLAIKYIFFISCLLFATCYLQCFAQSIIFQKTFGGTSVDDGNSIRQTIDGGYIICGTTASFGAGFYDVYLIKINGYGDTLWTKTFGGPNNDYGSMVQQTIDSGYIIAGFTQSFGMDSSDIYLIKTNSNGDFLWAKTFGGSQYDYGNSLEQTTDSGYVILGRTYSFGAGNNDVYMIKTDINGDMLWTKTYGGANNDEGYSVKQTTDGGYIIVGKTYGLGQPTFDIYLIKTDVSGDTLWTKTYGGTQYDFGYSVQQTSDGGFIIVGFTYSFKITTNESDLYLIKTDTLGNLVWSKMFGGVFNDLGNFVQQTADGGYIITGATQSFGSGANDVYLIKTDFSGELLWAKTFGGASDDYGFSVQEVADGGFIVIGRTSSFEGGIDNIYLIKTDSDGNSNECNQFNTNTSTISPITIAAIPATQVSSGGTANSTATQMASGGIVNTLCPLLINEFFNTSPSIQINPNPFSTKAIIEIKSTIEKKEESSLIIYDLFGIEVKHLFISNTGNKLMLERNNLHNGIYLLQLKMGNTIINQKFVLTD